MKNILKSNKGASEIVGALLLIAVVIVAVSGIAVIVAQVQKNEMERQSNIDAVEKENIKIMSILPVLNDTTGFLDALNVTITNLNSQDSRISTVIINDKAALNYTSTDAYNAEKLYSYTDRLSVPAGKAKVLAINFSTNYDPIYNVSPQKALKVAILTENGNIFSKMYMPPTPIIKTSIETENLGVAERDLLVLDGSDSFDDGSILSYQWNICNSSTYNSAENITLNTTGKRIRAYLKSTGPFYVWLNLTDDTNMIGISPEPVKIPENKNFNPPVSMNASASGYSLSSPDIKVTVKDAQGNNMPDIDVSFISISGSYTLSKYVSKTDLSGLATTTVTGVASGGVLRINLPSIRPIDVSITP